MTPHDAAVARGNALARARRERADALRDFITRTNQPAEER